MSDTAVGNVGRSCFLPRSISVSGLLLADADSSEAVGPEGHIAASLARVATHLQHFSVWGQTEIVLMTCCLRHVLVRIHDLLNRDLTQDLQVHQGKEVR